MTSSLLVPPSILTRNLLFSEFLVHKIRTVDYGRECDARPWPSQPCPSGRAKKAAGNARQRASSSTVVSCEHRGRRFILLLQKSPLLSFPRCMGVPTPDHRSFRLSALDSGDWLDRLVCFVPRASLRRRRPGPRARALVSDSGDAMGCDDLA